MRVEPTIGRSFRPEEDQVPGRDAVVVLGHAMWEQEFGVGSRRARPHGPLNGIEFTVIGVAPRRIHRHEPVRPLRLLRAADDVAAAAQRSEGGVAARRATRGT